MAKEVKLFAQLACDGAESLLGRARVAIYQAGGFSRDMPVSLPDTRYRLPVIYGLTGIKVERLADLQAPLDLAASLIGPSPTENPWLPYLGTALDAGVSALISAEILSALLLPNLPPGYLGFPSDGWVESYGSGFIGGGEVGFVLALGDPGERLKMVLDEFKTENVTILATGGSYRLASEQPGGAGGAPQPLFTLSDDLSGHAFSFGVLSRLAMMNGVEPGDHRALLDFCRRRLFGFVALFEDADPVARAFAAGGISFGLATIVGEYTPQLLPIYSVPRF
ncbi:MAG: hypothetical protein M1548_08790 [Actinobacteria bacterium]|nr:hypothetical protein [Actinomycetota bacterium]